MKRQLLAGVSVCMVLSSLIFGGSINAHNTQATQNLIPTPVNSDDLRVFPGDLVCNRQEKPQFNSGPSWMGITIGESTLEDVEQLISTFGDKYEFIDNINDEIRFIDSNTVSGITIPSVVRLCLTSNIVQSLAVTNPFPSGIYISDLVAKYGAPDVTTWDNGSSGRVVFWFGMGIAATVSLVPNELGYQPSYGSIGEIIYFSYQEVKGYDQRWPYNQTRKFNRFLVSPEDSTSDFGPENPFDFRAMIATITAEPSRTLTPTFAALPLTPTVTATP